MGALVYYITHPDVVMDPEIPVPQWPLSERGLARMRAMLSQPWVPSLQAIYASDEQKAQDGAHVIAGHLGLTVKTREALGENDRSSTGFLSQDEFFRHRDAFFNEPDKSVAGWETSRDAQARIVGAVRALAAEETADVLAIVAHGGVGALLLTSVMGEEISLDLDQPPTNGGNWFAFDAGNWSLKSGWAPIDP